MCPRPIGGIHRWPRVNHPQLRRLCRMWGRPKLAGKADVGCVLFPLRRSTWQMLGPTGPDIYLGYRVQTIRRGGGPAGAPAFSSWHEARPFWKPLFEPPPWGRWDGFHGQVLPRSCRMSTISGYTFGFCPGLVHGVSGPPGPSRKPPGPTTNQTKETMSLTESLQQSRARAGSLWQRINMGSLVAMARSRWVRHLRYVPGPAYTRIPTASGPTRF
jgi:hypothetical protein